MEYVLWLALGGTTMVAAVRARHSPRARVIARLALGTLFLVGGAVVNGIYLATGSTDYAGFADASYLPFVRDAWASIVAPNQSLWIGLLIAFEAIAGALVLSGGRWARVGIISIMVFHVCLLSFGWGFYAWSLPMLAACALLLRAERQEPSATSARSEALPAAVSAG